LRVFHIVRQFYLAMGRLENLIQCLILKELALGIQAELLTQDSVFHQKLGIRQPHYEQAEPIQVQRIRWCGSYKNLAPVLFQRLEGYDSISIHGVDSFNVVLALARSVHDIPQLTVYLL
jgi:alpha-1,3-mannosyltransferase